VPRHRIEGYARRARDGGGLQRGELDEEADLQGEGEGDDGEVLHGVSPCAFPYGGPGALFQEARDPVRAGQVKRSGLAE
jgi:hypothetical protein